MIAFWALGQIWYAQVVIYPLFARVGAAEYIAYHRFYGKSIPLVVIVPGFLSFLVPIPLAFLGPDVPTWMSVTNVVTGLCGLAVTVGLAIPRHGILERHGKTERTIAELVRYNWPRTASITAQAAVTSSCSGMGYNGGRCIACSRWISMARSSGVTTPSTSAMSRRSRSCSAPA